MSNLNKWLIAVPFIALWNLGLPALIAGRLGWFLNDPWDTVFLLLWVGVWVGGTHFYQPARHRRRPGPVLRKLETYRLYQAGHAVADIAEACEFSHGYLYEMWARFKAGGTEALVDKRWGAAPRKRTTGQEAAVLRAKALNPECGDSDLATEFGMDRSTIYRLLKEHGLQDLHRVLDGSTDGEADETPPEAQADDGEKGGRSSLL